MLSTEKQPIITLETRLLELGVIIMPDGGDNLYSISELLQKMNIPFDPMATVQPVTANFFPNSPELSPNWVRAGGESLYQVIEYRDINGFNRYLAIKCFNSMGGQIKTKAYTETYILAKLYQLNIAPKVYAVCGGCIYKEFLPADTSQPFDCQSQIQDIQTALNNLGITLSQADFESLGRNTIAHQGKLYLIDAGGGDLNLSNSKI